MMIDNIRIFEFTAKASFVPASSQSDVVLHEADQSEDGAGSKPEAEVEFNIKVDFSRVSPKIDVITLIFKQISIRLKESFSFL